MKKRMKLKNKQSKKLFRNTARRVNPKNRMPTVPMRGGIRL